MIYGCIFFVELIALRKDIGFSYKTSTLDLITNHHFMTDKRIKPVVDEKNFKEELALEKLTPLDVQRTNEDKNVIDYKSLKTPNNNPFKRRKDEDLQLDLTESAGEEILVISEDECEESSCDTSDNLILESSKKRKLYKTLSYQVDNFSEYKSEVTQEEDLVLLELTPESQKSVSSKISTVIGRKRVVGKENKRKSNCNSSGIQKNSILNFFSRV